MCSKALTPDSSPICGGGRTPESFGPLPKSTPWAAWPVVETTKNKRDRVVVLSPQGMEVLKRVRKTGFYVFPGPDGKRVQVGPVQRVYSRRNPAERWRKCAGPCVDYSKGPAALGAALHSSPEHLPLLSKSGPKLEPF